MVCLTTERNRQDARLNAVYQSLLASLHGDRRERIVQAQRAWLDLQKKDGAFEVPLFDELGQLGNLQSIESEARALALRADQLTQYLELSKAVDAQAH